MTTITHRTASKNSIVLRGIVRKEENSPIVTHYSNQWFFVECIIPVLHLDYPDILWIIPLLRRWVVVILSKEASTAAWEQKQFSLKSHLSNHQDSSSLGP